MEDGENQILVAKRGKKVLVIYYQGKERLEEKAGVLERVITGYGVNSNSVS